MGGEGSLPLFACLAGSPGPSADRPYPSGDFFRSRIQKPPDKTTAGPLGGRPSNLFPSIFPDQPLGKETAPSWLSARRPAARTPSRTRIAQGLFRSAAIVVRSRPIYRKTPEAGASSRPGTWGDWKGYASTSRFQPPISPGLSSWIGIPISRNTWPEKSMLRPLHSMLPHDQCQGASPAYCGRANSCV